MKTRSTQFSNWIGGLVLLMTVLMLGVTNTQAQTIFSQNFESTWTTPSTLSPAWSTAANATGGANALWAASNATTAQTGWSSTSGAYSPAGAGGTTKSARFHDYDCPSGGIGELYSPVMDFSTFSGEKAVSFYHINTSGTDVMRFAVSTDGGTTWGPTLLTLGVSGVWTQFVVPIGNTTSSTVRIKFGGYGTFGGSDIGIDEVNVFVYNPSNYNFTASALGGLWSNAATWSGGVVPPQGLANITIPSGSIVTVDQITLISSMSLSGVLQWNGTANALSCTGDFTINSGGRFIGHTTGAAGVTLNASGNFTNNGYANMLGIGSLTMNGIGSYSISGTGTFEGDGTNGIIRNMTFGAAGSYAINTSQNITVNASYAHLGGTLNTNGKLKFDNTAQAFGRPINTQLANVVVTGMGVAYTSDPVISSGTLTAWTTTGVLNTLYYANGNIYRCTTAGSIGATAPTHTSGITNNLLWIAASGTLAPNYFLGAQAHVVGTQYVYGDNLYLCTVAGTPSVAAPPTHTSSTAVSGTATFLYVGPAPKVSANRDATTSTIRSLNIVNAGSGLAAAPTITFNGGGATTNAAATAVLLQSVAGVAYMVNQKSGEARVTGGVTINSDQGASVAAPTIPQASSGVGAIYCTNGGANYTVAPTPGFSGPTALNLVTNAGSGYAAAPTLTISGGTQPVGQTAYVAADFTITMNQGKVVSIYLTNTTKVYITPPTITLTGTATAAFPTGCWPTATATIGSNNQILSTTITNAGYGYVAPPTVAVGTTSAGVGAGTYTTVSSGWTARIAAYYLVSNYYSGASAQGTSIDDAYIPSNRKMHALWLNGNDNGMQLSNNLTLISGGTGTTVSTATSPIALRLVASSSTTASLGQAGNVLDLGGNNLYCSWNGFAGATSTQGSTNAFVKNGSITLTTRGGGTTGSTLNFPFLGTQASGAFTVSTGTGTGAANGADVLTVKVTEAGAPGNSTSGGTGVAIGKRSFKVETTTVGGSAGTAGTNPTVTLHYNMTLANSGPDSLTTTQDQTFVSEAPTLNGAWTVRSTSIGASGALATNASKATATTAPGPITLASGNYYAWSTTAPTVTDVTPLSVCANSGTLTITGTNLSGVTAVNIGGIPVTAFTIVSSTQINIVAGAQTSGVITVVKGGASISGSQTVTWTGGPSAPAVSATTATTILTGQTVSFSATGSGTPGSEIRWYDQATGGVSLATGDTYTSAGICANKSYYAVEYDGSCEGPRAGVAVTVTRASISVSKSQFCGTGGADTLTATPSDPAITYTWSSLDGYATFEGGVNTGSTVVSTIAPPVNGAAAIKLTVTNNSCTDSSFKSIGVYALPSATVTTTASGVCPGTTATIGSGLSAGNFTASCIAVAARTAPSNATYLITNGTANVAQTSGNLDDGGWGAIPLGFSFNFFGTSYTTVNVGTNGVLQFGTYNSSGTGGLGDYTIGALPNTSDPKAAIFLGSHDWGTAITGTPQTYIRYWTEGYAPNRRFIIEYNIMTLSTTNRNNYQAILYETTGIVDIICLQTQSTSSKSIGVNSPDGTIGATAPNCAVTPNTASYWSAQTATIAAASPQAWRFAPPANYSVLWFANGTQFASGTNVFSQNVAPTTTTLYSITYTNLTTGCTNEPRSAEVNMLVLSANAPTGVNTISSVDSTCTGSTFLLSTDYTGLSDGLTFQWQSSTDGGANWTDISGATSLTYTASQSVVTSYRLKIVSCGGTPEYTTEKTVYFTNYITSVTSATRCGTGTVTLNGTANTGATISWYAAQTGGTALGSGFSYTTPSISATTIYWAEPRQAGCAGVRVADTAYVNPAPVLTLSSSSATICNGDASSLVTISAGANDYDVLNWTPSTGVSGDAANGYTFNPTATTTFTLNGSQSAGICANNTTFTVTVNPKPVIDSVGANNTTVCAGTAVNLTAYSAYIDAGSQTLPTGYCTVSSLGLDANSYFNSFSTTGGTQNITNSGSGYSAGGYGDFTAQGVHANAGQSVSFNTALTGTTVGVAIWVDWNHNGTFDASERMYNTTSYVSTASGSFTVPANATPGRTRMRIMMDYNTSNPSNPCAVSSTGRAEVEDYSFYVSNVSTIDPALTYNWTPGDLVGSAQTVTPSTTTTYTVTATNPTTGCVGTVSGSKTITVNQLPASPEVSNSEQCGNGVPACFATGTTNGNYRWYLAATGGSALAGQTNNTLSGYSISTTTTFYVAIYDGTCESNRVAVTASVTQPDAVTATVSSNDVCANTAITLTATQTGTTNTYVYEWSASPASGSGIATTESGSPVVVTPTAAGTYVYTVTATDATLGCTTTSTVSVTVKALPTFTSYSATPSTICAGDSVTLAANKTAVTNTNFNVGLTTDVTLSSLSAYGMYFSTTDAAVINTVDVYPSVAGTLTIQLKNATGTVVDTKNITIAAGDISTTVPKTVTLNFSVPAGSTGWQLYHTTSIYRGSGTYSYPYTSNGFSITGNTLDGNGVIGGTRYYFYNWNVTTTSSYDATSQYNWTWEPGGITTATARVAPASSTVYTVTMTDPATTCSNSATVSVTVNPVPPAPTATGSEQCGSGVPAASVASNSGAATPTYKWYTAAVGGTAVQTGTSATYTSSINTTTTFYVSEISDAGCEGPRAEVLATVNQPDAIDVTTTTTGNAICLNGTFDISAAYSPLTNLYDNYELTASPANGSGISGTTTLTVNGFGTDAYTVTPTAAGTYTYTITAFDNSFGCATQSTVTITVNSLPVIDSVKASATSICEGQSITVNAYSAVLTTGPQSAPSGYCTVGTSTNNADDQIFAVQFGSMNNTQTESCSSNYTDYTGIIAAPTVASGQSVPFSVTVNECDGATYYTSGISIFIDYNRDGDFDDAGEQAYTTAGTTTNPHTKSGTITIPSSASAGLTRMRVVAVESTGTPTACGTWTYGEAEDYAVNIIGQVLVNPALTYTWNPGSVNGSSATLTPTASGNISCTVVNANGCSATSSNIAVTVNPLPSAPIGTNSTQCGVGVPTVSVASGDATASPSFNWYNSATNPSYVTAYNNGFTTTLNGASVSGAAVLSGGQVVLTPNTTNQLGGLTIPAIGVNSTALNVAFNVSTSGGGGADGFSYSFGDDVSATATSPNAEVGTGSKLKIAFDDYGSGAGAAGIRVIYGSTINDPGTAVGTNGILAYSNNTSWLGSNNVPVVAAINTAGQLTLTVNGTSVFSNVQLPAGYTSANNSTWQHVFKARTGGLSMVHALDSVNISYYNSGLVNTGSTYPTSISQTTTFYVSELSAAGCEGPRTEVVATVNQPDTLVASSNGPVCLGASVTLTATVTSSSNSNTYGLTWNNAQAGSGMSTATSGGTATYGTPATVTVTPTAAGTYTFTLNGVDGACSASSSVSVVVNPNPIVSGVTATPTTICAGSSVTLTGASVTAANGSIVTGTGTTYSSASSYPAMFENYWYQSWQQYIYRASELTALGLGAGNITSLKFNISALPSPVVSYTDYTVKIGTSTANTASTTFQTTGLTTVYGPGNIVPVTGLNTITFSSPYNWDGTSDLVVDIRQTGQYGSGNSTTQYTSTAYNSVRYQYSSSNNSGFFTSNPTATTSTSRPNMTLNGVVSSNAASSYNWSWTGGATGNPATATNVTANTDFYGTATNPTTGCSTVSSTPVSVTVVPVSATATSSVTGFSCAGSAVTLTANPVGQGPFTYQWSDGATNLGTSATQSVSPTANTTYTVTVKDACNNPTTADVTVNVNALPTASIAESGPATICAPSTQTLTAVPSVSTVTYQWMLNGTNISGATAATYNATLNGTYTVKVTDTTIACTSAPSAGFVLTVNPQPSALVITPASTTICNGQSAALSVSGGTVTTNNVVALAENFDNNAPTWNITNTGTAGTQAWIYRTAPFTISSGSVVFNAFSTPQGGKFPLVNADAGGTGSTTTSTIESPVFNTTNFTSATLTFEQVLRRQTGDVAKVQISTNGGSTWNDVANYTTNQGTTTASAQVATTTSITLTAGYLNQSNLKLRFNYSSGYGFYWLVDNVRISGTTVQNYTYNWTPSGSLSAATGASVTATPSETTTYTVAVTTQNGCTRSNTVTVNVNPRPTAVISGGATYCANQSSTTSLSIDVTGTGPWSGTLSNGQSFSGSSSPISVSVTPTATTTYTVATLSDANCTAVSGDLSGSAIVTIITNPVAPTASVVQPTCATATGTINVTAPVGVGFTYSIGGAFQSSTSFSGVTPGTYSLSVQNSAGCAALTSTSVTVNPQPFIPSAATTVVTGQTNICNLIGTNAAATYVANAAGATSYTWVLPPNTVLVSGQGTNTISVRFLAGFAQQANKQIRVTPSSVCGNSGFKIYYLSAQLPGTPAQIVASTSNVCPSLGTNVPIIYRIPKVMGAAYYQWTAQNGTTSITSLNGAGENDTAIAVTFTSSFSSSSITVQSFNDCGASGVRSLTVYRFDPSTPGLISGPANACEYIGASGQTATYTVGAIAGVDTYTWTLPQGATNVSGQGTNSVSFKYPAGYTGGSISVSASNGCGTSGTRSLSIAVLAPSYPGQIDVINLSACPNRSYSYTVAGLPSNATSLQWTVPAGGTIVSGQGTNSIVVSYASTVIAGNVSVVAVNNCGTSLPRRSEVKLASCPTGFAGTVPNKGATTVITPSEEMSVKVFPNPTTSNFNLQVITAGEEMVKVRVLDVQGRFIKEVKVQPYQTVNMGAELKAGAYMIEVRQGNQVKTTRVLKF